MPNDPQPDRDSVRQLTEAVMTDPAKTKSGVKLCSERGEYELGNRIGKGGMGEVFEVTRHGKLLGVKVAKVLHQAAALSEEACAGLLKEAQIAFQIVHPNLVGVTDIGMLGDAPFIIMERVDGVNLREFVAAIEKPIPLEVVIFIIGEVAAALVALHDFKIGGKDAGVVHSDVTTGNILISSSGHVKLTDFGIARFAHNDVTRSRPIGTPSYMSPEQRLGKTPRATDLFSLGMIFWELLEGGTNRYLADLNELERTQAMLNGYIPPFTRPGIPEDAMTLCRQMLSPDPENRPLAGELSEIIIDKWLGYMHGRKKIEELYHTHIGPKRTGMTKLLNTADFFPQVTPEPSPVKLTLESDFSAPSASPDERTVAENREPDAPFQFRRRRTSSHPRDELTPGTATRVTAETGTESPPSHARAQSLGDGPELPPMLVHEPAPVARYASEDNPGSANQSGPLLERTQTDEMDKVDRTVVLDPPTFAEPIADDSPAGAVRHPVPHSTPLVSEQSTPLVTEQSTPLVSEHLASAPVTELRRRNAALWVLSAGVGVVIILLIVIVALGVTGRLGAPRSTSAAKVEPVEPPPDEASAAVALPVEPPVGPTVGPTVGPVAAVVEEQDTPPDLPAEEGPPLEGLESPEDPNAADDAEQEKPKPKPRKKPKPAPKRTMVVFLFSGEAEIAIGRIKIKGKTYATKELRLKTYPVRWRTLPNGEWHNVGDLTIEELAPNKAYQVRLKPSGMDVSDDATRGSK